MGFVVGPEDDLFHPAEGDVPVVIAEKVAGGEGRTVEVAVNLEHGAFVLRRDNRAELFAKLGHRHGQSPAGGLPLFEQTIIEDSLFVIKDFVGVGDVALFEVAKLLDQFLYVGNHAVIGPREAWQHFGPAGLAFERKYHSILECDSLAKFGTGDKGIARQFALRVVVNANSQIGPAVNGDFPVLG